MTTNKNNGREICMQLLMEITENGEYIHTLLRNALDAYAHLDKRERSFIARVTEGTIEYMIQLDAVINRYSRIKTWKMKPYIRNLLRMSVYQLLYMDSVPDSAVCNEAVKLAARRNLHGLKGFVNGVLRTVSREKESLEFSTLSEKYSMPQWIVDMWTEDYGEAVTEQILKAFLEPKKLYIRCNRTNCTIEQLTESLRQDGAAWEKAPYVEDAFWIHGFDTLYQLKAFQKGYFQVQDLGSMLAVLAAGPEKGSRILDICAAPGGKALHMADSLNGTGMVEARDLTEAKTALIEENIERAGLTNIRAVQWDALEFDPEWKERADLVMADLPCSGLGVIGRKMDIKYKASIEKLEQLQQLQRDILDNAYQYIKNSGTLLYCTCTISRIENEENVQWLLDNYPLEPVSLTDCRAFSGITGSKEKGYIQLLPGIHNSDGFFIAKFRKKG